ncbi:MAG: hypothetical protein WCI36_02525 [bacterium]
MLERYVDKKIKVLESICRNDFRDDCVSNSNMDEISGNELIEIIEDFQRDNLLKISQRELLNNISDPSLDHKKLYDNRDEILVTYRDVDSVNLTLLLTTLKENYPKRSEPIIPEQTLKKIATQFENTANDSSIGELLKQWGISVPDIMYPKTKWDMAFSVLNHYAISARQEDNDILVKIIEEIVHPLMSDEDMKKIRKTVAKEYQPIFEQTQKTLTKKFKKPTELFVKDAKIENKIGALAYFSDGTIRFDQEVIKMRSQIKELCRLFIDNHDRLVTIDDIKEKIITAKKRKGMKTSSIAKYMYELDTILTKYYKKTAFTNQPTEGWTFKP